MTLIDTDVSSLSTLLSRWELAEYISAGFVTLACAGEGVADFTKWFTGGVKQRKERLAKLSTLLLIVSLSVELICLVKTNTLSGRLTGSLAVKAEAADKEAKAALRDSSTALSQAKTAESSLGKAEAEASNAQIASSNAMTLARGARQEAASFKEEIKSAREAATEANEKLADRALTDDQIKNITEKLVQFSGQEYTVTAYWDSKESLNIANRVHSALRMAHWSYNDEGSKSMLLGGTIGIFVSFHPDADENTKRAAESFVNALHSEGLEVSAKVQNSQNNPKHNKIWLTFGAKR